MPEYLPCSRGAGLTSDLFPGGGCHHLLQYGRHGKLITFQFTQFRNKEVQPLHHDGVTLSQLAPSGQLIASAGPHAIYVWDMPTCRLCYTVVEIYPTCRLCYTLVEILKVPSLDHERYSIQLAFPDGKTIVLENWRTQRPKYEYKRTHHPLLPRPTVHLAPHLYKVIVEYSSIARGFWMGHCPTSHPIIPIVQLQY